MLIVVAGAIANTAGKGGDTWHRLHWLLGLRRLGADVHLVEQLPAAACVDLRGQQVAPSESFNAAYFARVLDDFQLREDATLLITDVMTDDEERARALGEVRRRVADADLLVNISGHLDWKRLGLQPRRAVFIDEDPGFTQMWHASGMLGDRLAGHDLFYSIGAHVGTPHSSVPAGGIDWRPLRPFAVLDEWPLVKTRVFDRFTTVGGWRGPFAALEFEHRRYGVKAHEFRKFLDLPQRMTETFELALDIHPDDREDIDALHRHGWSLVDPGVVASTPERFRHYVQNSGAEFSVAKEMYVATNSGWFSDRTIRYLASGRPAVVQDTGWRSVYRADCGLISFRTPDEAIAACRRVSRNYADHSAAARSVAREHFDSDRVLGQFLDDVGVKP